MINYKRDMELMSYDLLERSLTTYNNQYADDRLNKEVYIHLLSEKKVIASLKGELYWNWVFIDFLNFESDDQLDVMLNTLYKDVNQQCNGIHIETNNPLLIHKLTERDFEIICVMTDKPKGYTSCILVKKVMNHKYEEHLFEVVSSEKNVAFHMKNNDVKKDFLILGEEKESHKIAYMAYDDDQWIGGVYGYIKSDYLHVNLLFVEKAYRTKGIAKKLMNLLHKESVDMGYENCFVETCTFHNKKFYEQVGYKCHATLDEMPIGYQDFILLKSSEDVVFD